MKDFIARYGSWTLVGVLLALCVFLLIDGCNAKHQRDAYKSDRDSCWRVKTKTDTLWRTEYIDRIVYHPVSKTIPIYIYDTILPQEDCKQNYYSENYENTEVRIHYTANVWGRILDFSVPQSICKNPKIIIQNRTIDTCINKLPAYRPINHYGIHLTLSGNNLDQFPNFGAGLFFTLKDRVGLQLGGEYNAYCKKALVTTQLDIFLK